MSAPTGRTTRELRCSSCKGSFTLVLGSDDPLPDYCIHCGSPISSSKALTEAAQESTAMESYVSFIQEHVPKKDEIKFTVGPYQVLRSIGKGGMGEVFLAYDSNCGRRIALKRVRPDLKDHPNIETRFLKEARITSQLTHPAIIPIYAIHEEPDLIFYTMPFVGGETLKQILRTTKQQEKNGEVTHYLGSSIPALVRVFIQVCQAVAYSHSKGVLHRDLKPENVIVGPYGEVLILDWGLAKLMGRQSEEDEELDEESEESSPHPEITRMGKVVGTLSYMAPERAFGRAATIGTEIYALGVILYQLLTLALPFRRASLKEFRKNLDKEVLPNPIEVAPYRDIPRVLVGIMQRCLDPSYKERYQSVDELLHELESYIEGRSEWFRIAEFDIRNKGDWEFQENVLIAEHTAITRSAEISDWVSLMISKASFVENTKIVARVRIKEGAQGIGFLLTIPEPSERAHLNDGYCLWIGTESYPHTKLLRSTVEVISTPEIFLKENKWTHIRIEKVENNIYFYLNDTLQFSYVSHLPLTGSHIGFLSRDDRFDIDHFYGYTGSQNVTVNCLAVPDAFLSHKNYEAALSEYRRIGYSFPGRAEGREAMFRAGITLLEQARHNLDPKLSEKLYDLSMEEFEKLHGTPGAPLEYLGKALVYQALKDYEEEIKCFELAYRRYPRHPLLSMLEEQIIYRLHESSQYHRKAAYDFILLITRHLPKIADSVAAQKLFRSLQKHWEPLPFIEHPDKRDGTKTLKRQSFNIELSFWLAKPYILLEICDELAASDQKGAFLIGNALFCLIELGAWQLAENHMKTLLEIEEEQKRALTHQFDILQIAINSHRISLRDSFETFFAKVSKVLDVREERVLLYLLEKALMQKQTEIIHEISTLLENYDLTGNGSLWHQYIQIFAYLLDRNWDKAGELLHLFSLETLNQEDNPLHFLYGCWLYVSEGKELAHIHFSGVLDVPYPRTWSLFSHYLKGKIGENQKWFQKGFLWEKRQLYKQLWLFYHCAGDTDKAEHYHALIEHEAIHID